MTRNWVHYNVVHHHWQWSCKCGEWDYAESWIDAHALLADHYKMGYHVGTWKASCEGAMSR